MLQLLTPRSCSCSGILSQGDPQPCPDFSQRCLYIYIYLYLAEYAIFALSFYFFSFRRKDISSHVPLNPNYTGSYFITSSDVKEYVDVMTHTVKALGNRWESLLPYFITTLQMRFIEVRQSCPRVSVHCAQAVLKTKLVSHLLHGSS